MRRWLSFLSPFSLSMRIGGVYADIRRRYFFRITKRVYWDGAWRFAGFEANIMFFGEERVFLGDLIGLDHIAGERLWQYRRVRGRARVAELLLLGL